MTEQKPLTDTDEPIGTQPPDADDQADVEGHGLVNEGFQRPPATSRNAERPSNHGCRTPARTPLRRGER